MRGADVGIWRWTGPAEPGFVRRAPVLAVEDAGRDEGERELRKKATWYRTAGVPVVWIVRPEEREVIVVSAAGEQRVWCGDRLPEESSLPGLAPAVDGFFVQLSSSRF